jgi:hypothetical protein
MPFTNHRGPITDSKTLAELTLDLLTPHTIPDGVYVYVLAVRRHTFCKLEDEDA